MYTVRGTATELDAADLRPGLTVAATDGVIRSPSYDGTMVIVSEPVVNSRRPEQPP